MAIVLPGTGAVVRPITATNNEDLHGPVQLCVNEGDTCQLGTPSGYAGPPWMRRVIVRFTPVVEQSTAPPILDESGQALHCIWRFECVQELRKCITEQGIRRVDQWSPGYAEKDAIFVESNGGSFRIPRGVQLFFGGGSVDSLWNIDVQELLDHNWGHPDRFALDTFNVLAGTPIIIGMEHVLVQPLAGTLTINGAAVTTPGSLPEISVAPNITAGANSLYRTFVDL